MRKVFKSSQNIAGDTEIEESLKNRLNLLFLGKFCEWCGHYADEADIEKRDLIKDIAAYFGYNCKLTEIRHTPQEFYFIVEEDDDGENPLYVYFFFKTDEQRTVETGHLISEIIGWNWTWAHENAFEVPSGVTYKQLQTYLLNMGFEERQPWINELESR